MACHTHLARLATLPNTCDPLSPCAVYLLHFPDGSHYIGSTSITAHRRFKRHLAGSGSRWVAQHSLRVGKPELALVIPYPGIHLARLDEKRHKANRQPLYNRCPFCHPPASGVCENDS